MGLRGPAPLTQPALQLRGSKRAKAIKNAPVPVPGKPSCPRWLEPDAKIAFRWVVRQLDFLRVLSKSDTHAIIRYATLWARWKRAELHLQKYGDTYPLKDELGRVRCFMPWPQVPIATKLAQQLTRHEQEFGLTPSSRTRIQPLPETRPTSIHDARVKHLLNMGPHPDEIFGKGALNRHEKARKRMEKEADEERKRETDYQRQKAYREATRRQRKARGKNAKKSADDDTEQPETETRDDES